MCVYVKNKPPTKINLIGDFNYSFLDSEVNITAIITIKTISTINLLSIKFKLSKLYRI